MMKDYIKDLYKKQKYQKKNFKDISREILIALALVAAGGIILKLSHFPWEPYWWVALVWFIPVAAIIYGLVRLIYYPFLFLRPKRKIICPGCSTSHVLWKKADFYACPKCELPIFISGLDRSYIQYSCPQCQQRFASDIATGSFRCSNCGSELLIDRASVSLTGKQSECAWCQAKYPEGSFACPVCWSINHPRDPVLIDKSLETLLARDKRGLLCHWRGRLEEDMMLMREIEPHDPTPLQEILDEIIGITREISRSGLLDEQELREPLARLIRAIDQAYAFNLIKTYNFMKSKPDYKHPQIWVENLYRRTPAAEYRFALEMALDPLTKDMGWNRPLLQREDYKVTGRGGRYFVEILDPEMFKEEALRINPVLEGEINWSPPEEESESGDDPKPVVKRDYTNF